MSSPSRDEILRELASVAAALAEAAARLRFPGQQLNPSRRAGRGIPSPEVDKRPLVIGPVHVIGVSSERNHTQRVVLFRTRGLRHHHLTPVFMPGLTHHQFAERFPQLRLPAIQGSGEIVMWRPRAAIFQLTNTPELRDTLLPASHSSL